MEGKIEIKVASTNGLDVDVDLSHVSRLDILVLFDTLAQSLDLDEADLKLISFMFAVGGLGALPGVSMERIKVPKDLTSLIREMEKEKDDD